MKQPSWLPEDGQLLKHLREKAGIDIFVFARTNTLSTTQLKELEEGVGNSFYNAQIKRSTGLKLLKKLGHVSTPQGSASSASDNATDSVTSAANQAPDCVTHDTAPAPASQNKHKGFSLQILIWLSVAALLAALLLFGRDWTNTIYKTITSFSANIMAQSQESAPNSPPVVSSPITSSTPVNSSPDQAPARRTAETTHNASASSLSTESPKTFEALSQIGESPTPLVRTAEEASVKPLAPVNCADRYRQSSVAHTPTEPLRAGDYIFFEALENSQLCVLDAQNKLTTVQLDAGMKRRISGEAPFLVHTSNWQHLKMFYQGRRVQTGDSIQQHMVLNSQFFAP
jgi:hypothetical protein